MRSIFTFISAISILLSGSSALSAECENFYTNGEPDKAHVYDLVVTSTSGSPVRISGSVALMGPDNFVRIDAETPYRIEVCGMNILLIVSALDTKNRIDFSFSMDGRELTGGTDTTAFAVGEDTPKPGQTFASNYRVQDSD